MLVRHLRELSHASHQLVPKFELVDPFFVISVSSVNLEESKVCIAFFELAKLGPLARDRTVQRGQAKIIALEFAAGPSLSRRELAILGNVQAID